jgi:hypothetical protein
VLHSDDPPEEFLPLTREDPSAFSPPPAFGPFRVLHQIGIGALGPVYRTYEPTRDRLIAVKVFRLDIIPEQAEALATALGQASEASLFHPSIVAPIAAGMEGTVAYRAEEYVAAESLDVAMRHYAPAALGKVLPFITQLAGAIDFARAAGVGHGGLHPRDIFVTPDEARATGFGVVEALEAVGLRAPTRRPYASPERIDGKPWGTPADVFSLAAIAFELLSGRRPAGTGAQIGNLPDGEHSAALQTVLARAMADAPGDRFATALAFAAALDAAGRGVAAAAPPITAPVSVAPAAVAPVDRMTAAGAPLDPMTAAGAPVDRMTAAGAPVDPVLAGSAPVDHTTAAGAPVDPVLAGGAPVDHTPAAVSPVDPTPPAAARVLQPPRAEPPTVPPVAAAPVAATPGEFAIDKDLDPVLTGIDDEIAGDRGAAAQYAAQSLFDESSEDARAPYAATPARRARAVDDELADLGDIHTSPERFADEFVEEQSEDAEDRRPLEALHETVAPAVAAQEIRMFDPAAPEPPDDPDGGDYSRMPLLPVALAFVIGLIGGFGAAYFLFHGRTAPPATTAVEQPRTPVPASGPATRETPGQYSEQKIAPRAAAPVPVPSPPPVSDETASGRAAAPRRGAAPLSRGRIVVSSTPNRASVTLDGVWRGRTPLTLENVPFGRHAIRVVQPGYDIVRDDFTLSAGAASHQYAARLERTAAASAAQPAAPPRAAPRTAVPPASATPESFSGSLYVDSRPRGATVFVDGRSVGQTPLSVPEVAAGSHVVRLEMPGKRTWSTSTRVIAGQTARVTGSLEDQRHD